MLQQEADAGQFFAYLLHALENASRLSGGGFFYAFDVLGEQALVHADPCRQCFGIDHIVKFEETGQIERDPEVICRDGYFLIFQIEVDGFENIGLKFFQFCPLFCRCKGCLPLTG